MIPYFTYTPPHPTYVGDLGEEGQAPGLWLVLYVHMSRPRVRACCYICKYPVWRANRNEGKKRLRKKNGVILGGLHMEY